MKEHVLIVILVSELLDHDLAVLVRKHIYAMPRFDSSSHSLLLIQLEQQG